jgi:hypothetical protein
MMGFPKRDASFSVAAARLKAARRANRAKNSQVQPSLQAAEQATARSEKGINGKQLVPSLEVHHTMKSTSHSRLNSRI